MPPLRSSIHTHTYVIHTCIYTCVYMYVFWKAGIRSCAYHDWICAPQVTRFRWCTLDRTVACLPVYVRLPSCWLPSTHRHKASGHLKEWRRHATPHHTTLVIDFSATVREGHRGGPASTLTSYGRWITPRYVGAKDVCVCMRARARGCACIRCTRVSTYTREWFDLGRRAYRVATPTENNWWPYLLFLPRRVNRFMCLRWSRCLWECRGNHILAEKFWGKCSIQENWKFVALKIVCVESKNKTSVGIHFRTTACPSIH